MKCKRVVGSVLVYSIHYRVYNSVYNLHAVEIFRKLNLIFNCRQALKTFRRLRDDLKSREDAEKIRVNCEFINQTASTVFVNSV